MRKYESQVRTKYNGDSREQFNTPTGQTAADYQLFDTQDHILNYKIKLWVL